MFIFLIEFQAIGHEIVDELKSGKGISDQQVKELEERIKILLRKIAACKESYQA